MNFRKIALILFIAMGFVIGTGFMIKAHNSNNFALFMGSFLSFVLTAFNISKLND